MQDGGPRVAGEKPAAVDNRDAVRESLDLRKSVRSEQDGGCTGVENLGPEEMAKFRCCDHVDAARGFVEKQDARLMEQSARQTDSLHCS